MQSKLFHTWKCYKLIFSNSNQFPIKLIENFIILMRYQLSDILSDLNGISTENITNSWPKNTFAVIYRFFPVSKNVRSFPGFSFHGHPELSKYKSSKYNFLINIKFLYANLKHFFRGLTFFICRFFLKIGIGIFRS